MQGMLRIRGECVKMHARVHHSERAGGNELAQLHLQAAVVNMGVGKKCRVCSR